MKTKAEIKARVQELEAALLKLCPIEYTAAGEVMKILKWVLEEKA